MSSKLKYDPKIGDVLPDGYYDLSPEDREVYWTTRATYFDLKIKAQQYYAGYRKRRSQAVMARLLRKNLEPCAHTGERYTVTYLPTERGDTAIDGGEVERCTNCRETMKVLA